MKPSRVAALSVMLAAVGAFSACGGKSGGGGGSGPKPNEQATSDTLAFDVEHFAATDNSVRAASSSQTSWNVRVAVNGEEKAKLEKAGVNDVSDSLKGMRFRRSDVVRLEMTVSDALDSSKVFATNLQDVAYRNDQTRQIWDQQCAATVNPEVQLLDKEIVETSDGSQAKIQLEICDFVGFSLKPTVQIKPQQQMLEKKTVIYKCTFKPSVGTRDLWQYGNQPCTYGYTTIEGETAPTITILKEFAPDSPLFNANAPVQERFELDIGSGGQPELSSSFRNPAFGSNAACHTTNLDVKYSDSTGIKTARLTFKRFTNTDGSVVWAPQDSGSWPSLDTLEAYYRNASNEKLTLYRICEWIPELADVESGSVVQFVGQ